MSHRGHPGSKEAGRIRTRRCKPAGASRLTYKDPTTVVSLRGSPAPQMPRWAPASGETPLIHRAGRLSAASAFFEAGQLIGLKPGLSEDSHPWLLNDGRALDAISLPEKECVFTGKHK